MIAFGEEAVNILDFFVSGFKFSVTINLFQSLNFYKDIPET
ncbi:hypothetical protein SAMN05444146_2123 [Flavobacterium johnsoniae]|nr:hypothetical protein SAMN05444146_2123 [Flavobacterium johnsoniae]